MQHDVSQKLVIPQKNQPTWAGLKPQQCILNRYLPTELRTYSDSSAGYRLNQTFGYWLSQEEQESREMKEKRKKKKSKGHSKKKDHKKRHKHYSDSDSDSSESEDGEMLISSKALNKPPVSQCDKS